MQTIQVRHDVSFKQFHDDIVMEAQPVVLKGMVKDWPAVVRACHSSKSLSEYLTPMCNDQPVIVLVANRSEGGRFFYTDDLQGLNFQRASSALPAAIERLLNLRDSPSSPSLSIQAISVRDVCPTFEDENLQVLLGDVAPALWIGNQGSVAPHFDIHNNLACVIGGRRHFSLFPPSQVKNIYPGPALFTPAGVPVSMVDMANPDFEKFPRFREALQNSQQALLEPGDAIYIPSLWWHGVRSLAPFNMLVNYWWGGMSDSRVSPYESLLHSMMSIKKLDVEIRHAWRVFFDYYVFGTDADTHLPTNLQDLVSTMSLEQTRRLQQMLSNRLLNAKKSLKKEDTE